VPSPGTPKSASQPEKVTYKVFVRTSDIAGAGTDANVWLSIRGQLRREEKLQLKKSLTHLDKFERGQEDVFEFALAPLGALESVMIGHDNATGLLNPTGAAWHLDCIEILDENSGKRFSFPCKQWLAKDKGDEKIEREIACSTPPPPLQVPVVSSEGQNGGRTSAAKTEREGGGVMLSSAGGVVNASAVTSATPASSSSSSSAAAAAAAAAAVVPPRRNTMFPPRVGGMSVWDMCVFSSTCTRSLSTSQTKMQHFVFKLDPTLTPLAATITQTSVWICLSAPLSRIQERTRGECANSETKAEFSYKNLTF
jgi:hypothetical protein